MWFSSILSDAVACPEANMESPTSLRGKRGAQREEQSETENKDENNGMWPEGRTDLLLRFFASKFFDEWIAVSYLWRSTSQGVHDYLCNRVWTLTDIGIERYLHQLCTLLVLRPSQTLERTVVGLCRRSLRIALKTVGYLRALAEDNLSVNVARLLQECEESIKMADWPSPIVKPIARSRLHALTDMTRQHHKGHNDDPRGNSGPGEGAAQAFDGSKDFINALCDLGFALRKWTTQEARQQELTKRLYGITSRLEEGPAALYPLGTGHSRILSIPPEEAVILNSREKAPFFLCVEVLADENESGNPQPEGQGKVAPETLDDTVVQQATDTESESSATATSTPSRAVPSTSVTAPATPLEAALVNGKKLTIDPQIANAQMAASSPRRHRRVSSDVALEEIRSAHGQLYLAQPRDDRDVTSMSPDVSKKLHTKSGPKKQKSGESWQEKCERVRKESNYGRLRQWKLSPMIVKSGDDCRQELLASQVISELQSIATDAGLPLWLRPYEIFPTSAKAALIEAVPDAPAIHSLKSRGGNGAMSLRDILLARHRAPGQGDASPVSASSAFKAAQKCFVESLAGYSLACHILQLKDRHNGNILLDSEGHLIHIDFSFMLSNTPGNLNFESAPFKLTREYLEVMDSDAEGTPSDMLNYFKVLMIQGFLAARKHAEKIVLLVDMLSSTSCPCFKSGGPKVVAALRRRFKLGLTEEQCVEHVLALIGDSLDAWCTRQYDFYQRVVNGIL